MQLMKTTFKFKGWPVLLTTLFVLILQFTSPAQIWTMLLIGLGLLQVIAYTWAKSLQTDFRLKRERRYGMAQVGDRVEERFTISKEGIFPALWVEIIDHSTMPNYTASQVTGLGVHSSIRWQTENICTQRGVFRLGPTEVNLGDPFGLFSVQHWDPHSVDFTVAPPIVTLPEFRIASRGHVGEGTPRLFSLAPTEPTASVRTYLPTDSLNRVHWPTTARRDSLYVRTLQETTSGDWWIVLDMDIQVHQGKELDSTLEKGILVAASLADRGLREQQAVGFLAHGQETVWLPPRSIELQEWQILRALAKIEGGQLSLDQLLIRSNQLIKQNTSLIIITPATNSDWLDPLLMFRRNGVVPTVILLYTAETRPTIEALHYALALENITAYPVDAGSIIPPTPEELAGRWEWRTLSTGRVVTMHRPLGEWETLQGSTTVPAAQRQKVTSNQ